MESKQLFWDSAKKNYALMFGDSDNETLTETDNLVSKTFQRERNSHSESEMKREVYLPFLDMLLQKKSA